MSQDLDTQAGSFSLNAHREDYQKLQVYAASIKQRIAGNIAKLQEREHAPAMEALADLAGLANSVRSFCVRASLSSKYSRDDTMLKTFAQLTKWTEDARRDAQTMVNLMMNEFRNT